MSLLHPTPGEIHNRLCVVNLKISAFIQASIDTSSLESERKELHELAWTRCAMEPIRIAGLVTELTNANCEIWTMEDEIRNTGEDTVEHLALVGKRIARYNDERNRLIREIDEAYGCENPVEEKIYRCTVQK